MATRRLAKPRPVQGEQAPPRRPAEEPGKPQRRMVTLDRIRLTGLLRKTPATRGFSIWGARETQAGRGLPRTRDPWRLARADPEMACSPAPPSFPRPCLFFGLASLASARPLLDFAGDTGVPSAPRRNGRQRRADGLDRADRPDVDLPRPGRPRFRLGDDDLGDLQPERRATPSISSPAARGTSATWKSSPGGRRGQGGRGRARPRHRRGQRRLHGKLRTMHQDGIQVMGGSRITLRGLSINCGRHDDTDQLEPLHQARGTVGKAADRRRLRRLLPRRLGRPHGEHPGVGALRARRLTLCSAKYSKLTLRSVRTRSTRSTRQHDRLLLGR